MKNNRAYLLRTEITKSHLNNRICQHCGVKTSMVTPSFYYVYNISLSCNINIPSFIGNLWWDLLLGNHLKSQRSKFRISSRGNLHSNLPKITLWEEEAFSWIYLSSFSQTTRRSAIFWRCFKLPASSWGPRKSEMLQVDWQIRSGSDSVACFDWSVLIPEVWWFYSGNKMLPQGQGQRRGKVKVKAKSDSWRHFGNF